MKTATYTAKLLPGRKADTFGLGIQGPDCPPFWAVCLGGHVAMRADSEGRPFDEASALREAAALTDMERAEAARMDEFAAAGEFEG